VPPELRPYDYHPLTAVQHTAIFGNKTGRKFVAFRQSTRPDRVLGAATRQFLFEDKGKLVKKEELEGRTCYSSGLTLNRTG